MNLALAAQLFSNYSSTSSEDAAFAAITGLTIGLFLISFVLSMALTVLMLIAQWKIFVKAGEPGWYAIVPFLNTYITFKIIYGNGWKMFLMFLMLIPIIGWVVPLIFMFRMGQVFGKSTLFNIVAMVIFSFIGWIILAFDKKAVYQGPINSFM